MPVTIDVFEDPLSDEGKVFYIDNRVILYHDTEMFIHEVAGFMYGSVLKFYDGINTHEGYSTITITDTSGDSIGIHVKSLAETHAEDHRIVNEIVTALWKYVGNKLVNDMMSAIGAGVEVKVGTATAHKGGIRFENLDVWGKTMKWDVPWEVVGGQIHNGRLMIYCFTDKNCTHWLDLRTVMHAHTLYGILRMIMSDPPMMLILKGHRVPLPYYPPND